MNVRLSWAWSVFSFELCYDLIDYEGSGGEFTSRWRVEMKVGIWEGGRRAFVFIFTRSRRTPKLREEWFRRLHSESLMCLIWDRISSKLFSSFMFIKHVEKLGASKRKVSKSFSNFIMLILFSILDGFSAFCSSLNNFLVKLI